MNNNNDTSAVEMVDQNKDNAVVPAADSVHADVEDNMCQIEGCTNKSWRKCNNTLDWPMVFGRLWKSCDRGICR